MSKYLNLPPELEQLIEKREFEERRQQERRDDATNLASLENISAITGPPTANAHTVESADRRSGSERRQASRRSDDPALDA